MESVNAWCRHSPRAWLGQIRPIWNLGGTEAPSAHCLRRALHQECDEVQIYAVTRSSAPKK